MHYMWELAETVIPSPSLCSISQHVCRLAGKKITSIGVEMPTSEHFFILMVLFFFLENMHISEHLSNGMKRWDQNLVFLDTFFAESDH